MFPDRKVIITKTYRVNCRPVHPRVLPEKGAGSLSFESTDNNQRS